ncbi:VWA domain-containing protein [Colwellia sp. RSH04]|uniref:vWA domain-containing protein n=1 Tax=Colwellia sp. RSH04 TaxID=2305464 RepID=UPI000E58263D|nr:VWA domain-containing protein [Colwellia sp. RSH04]RHW76983.1 VWA domain-containing protein [Colwellia sp. RSH04]
MDLTSLQHFHFLRPYWFLAFIAFIVILKLFAQRDDTLAVWRKVMSANILKKLTVEGNNTHWLSPQKLSLAISVPLCLVLMGPTWQQQPSPFSENNAPLIIALDVSETMEQNDIQPSRLLRAKQKILQLLELRGDTKTALIAYAGSAHTVMPITNDREMIRHFLDVLTPNLMPIKGKIPQTVLPLADSLLASSQVPGTLLMIGDGATQETNQQFTKFFNKQQHQLIVWAIGQTEERLTTEPDNTLIAMQLPQLQALARAGDGRLVTMTHDQQDVKQVNRYIENNLVIVDDKSRPWHDAGYPLVFLISFIFLFWFRKGWTLQW